MGQSPHHQRESESCSVMSDFLQLHGQYRSWNSLGQNSGMGTLSLLHGILPTQELKPGLPRCRWILYQWATGKPSPSKNTHKWQRSMWKDGPHHMSSGEFKLIQQDTSSCLLEWPKSKTQTPNAGKDIEQWECSFIANGNAKWFNHFGRPLCLFLSKLNILLLLNLATTLLGIYPKQLKTSFHTKPEHGVYSSFIHSCQNWKLLRCPSVGEWNSGISRQQNITQQWKEMIKPWKDMEESWCILLRERSQPKKGYAVVFSRSLHVWLFMTSWTVACQAPLSMGFARQEYWSELPFPPPGDRPDPRIVPASLVSPALAGEFFSNAPRGKSQNGVASVKNTLAVPQKIKHGITIWSRKPLSNI